MARNGRPKKAQGFATGLQPSPELSTLLAKLSPKQTVGVVRIVEAELAGSSIESLFRGPDKICSKSTYYRDRGWSHQPKFQEALALARREARSKHLKSSVDDAIEQLKLTAPLAAQDLRRQIAGDEPAIDSLIAVLLDDKQKPDIRLRAIDGLSDIGTRRATDALIVALQEGDFDPDTRLKIVEALSRSASGINHQRRLASMAVLDRADRATAQKGEPSPMPGDLSHLEDDELDQLTDNLKAAIRRSAA